MRRKGFAGILLLVVILVIGTVGYFGFKYKKQLLQSSQTVTEPKNISPTSNKVSNTPQPSVSSKLYLVEFNLKSESNPPPIYDYPNSKYTLIEYLEVLFNLPAKSISNILFDTRNGVAYNTKNALLKRPYYLILNQKTKLDNSYSDQYLTAKTQTVNDDILPYLIKNDYCETDDDCSIRSAMCTVGAYNYYQGYIDPPWGCGPAGYKSTYSWFEYGMHDDELNCNLDSLKFESASCENHLCIEKEYKKVCI